MNKESSLNTYRLSPKKPYKNDKTKLTSQRSLSKAYLPLIKTNKTQSLIDNKHNFILDCMKYHISSHKEYNGLDDPALIYYFSRPRMKKLLKTTTRKEYEKNNKTKNTDFQVKFEPMTYRKSNRQLKINPLSPKLNRNPNPNYDNTSMSQNEFKNILEIYKKKCKPYGSENNDNIK